MSWGIPQNSAKRLVDSIRLLWIPLGGSIVLSALWCGLSVGGPSVRELRWSALLCGKTDSPPWDGLEPVAPILGRSCLSWEGERLWLRPHPRGSYGCAVDGARLLC